MWPVLWNCLKLSSEKQREFFSSMVILSQLMPHPLSSFRPVCFLTCIQISQEAGKVVWYSHLFQNFPYFFVIHAVKCFGVVSKTNVFLEFSCFFYNPTDVDNLISGSSAFSKSSLNICKFLVHILLKSSLENLSITLLACQMSAIMQ